MNKNKKGFTLIELLAVIVILALIALIAIPIVLNIIKKARLGAVEDSAYGLRKTAQLYYSEAVISDPDFSGIEFICGAIVEDGKKVDACVESDGAGNQKSNGKKLKIDGTTPSNGTINISAHGDITFEEIKYNNNHYNCVVPQTGNVKCSEGIIDTSEPSYVTENLILHYSVNESNGYQFVSDDNIKIIDLSGNDNDGALKNGTIVNGAIVINGSNSGVLAPVIEEPQVTLDITFLTNLYILTYDYPIISNNGCEILINGGRISGKCKIDGEYRIIQSDIAPEIGNIYHAMLTYNGNNLSLYVDGQLKGTYENNAGIDYLANTNWVLGSTSSNGNITRPYFSGKIYSLRIYNRALTATEIYQNYTINKNLYGTIDESKVYYNFPERNIVTHDLQIYYSGNINSNKGHVTTPTNWYDLSGNEINGRFENIIWDENAAVFNGSSSAIFLNLYKPTHITLDVTFLISDYPSKNTVFSIFSNQEAGGCGIELNEFKTVVGTCYIDGAYRSVVTTNTLELNKLYNVVLTYDKENVKLYLNSILMDSNSINKDIKYHENTVWALGVNPKNNNAQSCFFKGKIYSARLYSEALTSDEIGHNFEIDNLLYK